jgi:hypothetical protein
MESPETQTICQIACLPHVFEGYAKVPPESLARRLRLALRRSLNARQVRTFKTKSSRLISRFLVFIVGSNKSSTSETGATSSSLKAGDLVQVRSREEIQATLNPWGQLKGCMFMPEMLPYCGTTQRVLKRLERFVDERDYHVKKSQGIVLLEGLNCQGTSDYGRCDRACFYFWREEWLEKIDEGDAETIGESKRQD